MSDQHAHSHAPVKSCCGSHAHGSGLADGKARDPVCGMSVDPHAAKHRTDCQGRPYYFCSAGCKTKFEADPKRYLESDTAKQEPVPEGTVTADGVEVLPAAPATTPPPPLLPPPANPSTS